MRIYPRWIIPSRSPVHCFCTTAGSSDKLAVKGLDGGCCSAGNSLRGTKQNQSVATTISGEGAHVFRNHGIFHASTIWFGFRYGFSSFLLVRGPTANKLSGVRAGECPLIAS